MTIILLCGVTLSMMADPDDLIPEIHESNNIYGEQWVWTPLLLDFNRPERRSMPPDRTGGWEHLEGVLLWYNCDGAPWIRQDSGVSQRA